MFFNSISYSIPFNPNYTRNKAFICLIGLLDFTSLSEPEPMSFRRLRLRANCSSGSGSGSGQKGCFRQLRIPGNNRFLKKKKYADEKHVRIYNLMETLNQSWVQVYDPNGYLLIQNKVCENRSPEQPSPNCISNFRNFENETKNGIMYICEKENHFRTSEN